MSAFSDYRINMKINVNNRPIETNADTLAVFVSELALPSGGTAVGVDGRIVPRTAWSELKLEEGQNIVIIKAACGG